MLDLVSSFTEDDLAYLSFFFPVLNSVCYVFLAF